MASIFTTISYLIQFLRIQALTAVRVVCAIARRIFIGPTLPSWNFLFEVAIAIMRGSFVKDHNLTRHLIDSDISWLPIFPKNVHVLRGESLSDDCKSPFEWIYCKDQESPWDGKTVTPSLSNKKLIIYFHGGAFVYGARGGFHSLFLCHLVQATGAVVLFLDYKRSPEHEYPAPQDDCFAAYKWLVGELPRVGAKDVDVFVMGDSAGGALAVDTLVRIEELSHSNVKNSITRASGGILLSPWTDIFNFEHKSWESNRNYDYLEAQQLNYCANLHFKHENRAEQDKISPVNRNLKGLPPLLVEAGEKEAFVDQIQEFVTKAQDQGVSVSLNLHVDMVHAFHMLIFTRQQAIFRSIDNIERFIGEMSVRFDQSDINSVSSSSSSLAGNVTKSLNTSSTSSLSAISTSPQLSLSPSPLSSSPSTKSTTVVSTASPSPSKSSTHITTNDVTAPAALASGDFDTSETRDYAIMEILQRSTPPSIFTKGQESEIVSFLKVSDFVRGDIILGFHYVLDTVSSESKLIEDFYRSQFKICALVYVNSQDGAGRAQCKVQTELTNRIASGQIDYAIMVFELGITEGDGDGGVDEASIGSIPGVLSTICEYGPVKRRLYLDGEETRIEAIKAAFMTRPAISPLVRLFEVVDKEDTSSLRSLLGTYVEETLSEESFDI